VKALPLFTLVLPLVFMKTLPIVFEKRIIQE
jgi:hypothetical protein